MFRYLYMYICYDWKFEITIFTTISWKAEHLNSSNCLKLQNILDNKSHFMFKTKAASCCKSCKSCTVLFKRQSDCVVALNVQLHDNFWYKWCKRKFNTIFSLLLYHIIFDCVSHNQTQHIRHSLHPRELINLCTRRPRVRRVINTLSMKLLLAILCSRSTA